MHYKSSHYPNRYLSLITYHLSLQTMPTIKCTNLIKTYKIGGQEIHALAGVDFEVRQGEFVVIVGPSGSGKTSLLNLLGGMDTPTKGEILVGEQDIAKFNARQLTEYRRTDVGFVFQFYNLMPNLTALENVELSVEISKNPLLPFDVLEQVGLCNRAKNFPAQLSGGEQQRVSIARSVAKNPALILCDEPTGALDYETGKKILKLLHDISRTRTRAYHFDLTHKPKQLLGEYRRLLGKTVSSDIELRIENGELRMSDENSRGGTLPPETVGASIDRPPPAGEIIKKGETITQSHIDLFIKNKIDEIIVDTIPQTIILVTHNSALKDMADKVLFMKNGKIEKMEINETPKPIEEIDW